MNPMNLFLLTFGLGLLLCGCSSPETTEDTYTTESLVGYMTIEDNTLHLDEIEIITREDTDRINELGLIESNDYPSGYYLYNPIVDPISFELTDDTLYIFQDYGLLFIEDADGPRTYETTLQNEFLEGSSYQDVPLEDQRIPYFIEVDDQKVISITEDFIYTQ